MLRSALWTLRQPRYAKLAAMMFVIAVICAAAGTWQISRFRESVRDNNALDGNAHAAVAPLTTSLVPLVGHGPTPGRDAIRYRTVAASGTYVGEHEFVRGQSLNGAGGFYVLNPLRASSGVLLVVRGFVAATPTGTPPATVAAPPSGLVHITGRLQTATTGNDNADAPGAGEVDSINPAEQAARLGAPVYDAYLTLDAHQPGTAGVSVLPKPDLSNPAGGAYEGQHFAYIIQWYVFALLALAAPFALSRHERREARQRFLGIDTGEEEYGLERGRALDRRPELPAGTSGAGQVATRDGPALVRRNGPTPQQWQRAARLADRYGRALGIDPVEPAVRPAAPGRAAGTTAAARTWEVPSSATSVHRSHDAYHGSYNDYLWELALADGEAPEVVVPEPPAPGSPAVTNERPVRDELAGPEPTTDAATSGDQL